jgi:hypothetical protein
MSWCMYCEQEMTDPDVTSCVKISCVDDLDPVLCEEERCHDCNVTRGGYHHSGCDMERCPKCHGQIISCGCT